MGRSRVTDEQLRAAAEHARTMADLLTAVGLVPCGANYAVVRRRLAECGLLDDRFAPRPQRPPPVLPTVPAGTLAEAVAGASTHADVLRHLGHEPDPRLYPALRRAVEALGLDTGHFRGRSWSRGVRRPRVPLDELLVDGRPTSSGVLRQRLVAEGMRQARCEGCGLSDWRGQPIALELDHVNGRRHDNRLVNLRLLCPNCHAQTDTWRGRNITRRAADS